MSISVDRNRVDLESLVSRWIWRPTPLWHLGANWPFFGRRGYSNFTVVVRRCPRYRGDSRGRGKKRLDFLNDVWLKECCQQSYVLVLGQVLQRGRGKDHQIPDRGSSGLFTILLCFPSCREDGLHSYAFTLAVLLAKGKRWALMPL